MGSRREEILRPRLTQVKNSEEEKGPHGKKENHFFLEKLEQ